MDPRLSRNKPISSKPAEVRMGNGKGNPEFWVALVQPGRVIYELDGVDEALAREAFRLCCGQASAQVHVRYTSNRPVIGVQNESQRFTRYGRSCA